MQFIFGGPTTSLIVLVLEAVVLVGLYYGFYLMRVKKNRAAHEKNQTIWVLLNLVLILGAMAITFSRAVTSPRGVSPIVLGHATGGVIAELLGIYLILRMKNLLPAGLRIKNYKVLMQVTLALWTLVALGGFYIYYMFYLAPR